MNELVQMMVKNAKIESVGKERKSDNSFSNVNNNNNTQILNQFSLFFRKRSVKTWNSRKMVHYNIKSSIIDYG